MLKVCDLKKLSTNPSVDDTSVLVVSVCVHIIHCVLHTLKEVLPPIHWTSREMRLHSLSKDREGLLLSHS